MKIIVADDYYTNRLLVSEILRSLGHEFIEAEDGLQALEALKKHSDIDLVFMDIEMPVMSGVEAMKYIREKLEYPKNLTPIIALTAHTPGILNDKNLDAGFDQTLVKPYSIDKIGELLKKYKKS
jgi:hypothetical protein